MTSESKSFKAVANHDRALAALRHWFRSRPSVLVAFSGGVDSALVMAVAHEQLGPRALACIGRSPSYPRRELESALAVVGRLGAAHRVVDTREHLDADYAENRADRCFHCKNELYGRLRHIADDEDWDTIVDGTNASDRGDDRPGRAAASRHGVRSPLVELGIEKNRVRGAARRLGLDVWDKPAMACLSSRVPRGTPITLELLQRIERAEDVLVELGFRQFRVRDHGELARIELETADMTRAVSQGDEIAAGLRAVGYRHVCLDLAGYRAGGAAAPTVDLTVEGRA
ncbi:MAG: TIGR00268 family protein [Phycisphaeraceae bacterium]|nr:TIGR00268 family protein [Phycisphaeraceae bacterium]